MVESRVKWVEGMTFLGISSTGRGAVMSGADGPGVSPMQMLLLGLGGCASMDVVDILNKQRQPFADVEVIVSGERGEELPKPWASMHMHFIITGSGLDANKVGRAIDLSVEKYCGVHATLSGVAKITHDFELRDQAKDGEKG